MMSKIAFPSFLEDLLKGSQYENPIRSLADNVEKIVISNRTYFFPDYTDHGVDHIIKVLEDEVELIPSNVKSKSLLKDYSKRLLNDIDAILIIGGTLLHDIAMHIYPEGFLELVSNNSRFKPLPWFNENQDEYNADLPWHDLWEEYMLEVRRMNESDLINIIGSKKTGKWIFHDIPASPNMWDENHKRIIGEFIRRHHARIAHEIAIYGFPGLPVGSGNDEFPEMGRDNSHQLHDLADLIGLTARSHWLSLRTCQKYLDSQTLYSGMSKPMNSAVLYPMALLRIADYLQIDKKRAPSVLLKLRNPQSPVSLNEWEKHKSVINIGRSVSANTLNIKISPKIDHSIFLQLSELIDNLQTEIDLTSAILLEIYGRLRDEGLNELELDIKRIESNIMTEPFRNSLIYVPEKTGYSADPNILSLLIQPLYGNRPDMAIRELMQNAIDAMHELKAWCEIRKTKMELFGVSNNKPDIKIIFKKEKKGWRCTVRDKGIGMKSKTIQNYYLRAGSSFRQSSEWINEYVDRNNKPILTRSGRFGIGVFSVFLLGNKFIVKTRHIEEDNTEGYEFEAGWDCSSIVINKNNQLSTGTTIEIDLNDEAVEYLGLNDQKRFEKRLFDWYCFDWPKIAICIDDGKQIKEIKQDINILENEMDVKPKWSKIYPKGYDSVYWTYVYDDLFSCNGIKVNALSRLFSSHNNVLLMPSIVVMDSKGILPLTIKRDSLQDDKIPFISELNRDIAYSVISHMLVYGPKSYSEIVSPKCMHPLYEKRIKNSCSYRVGFKELFSVNLPWCFNKESFIIADPSLYPLLNAKSYYILGLLSEFSYSYMSEELVLPKSRSLKKVLSDDSAMLLYGGNIKMAWMKLETAEILKGSRTNDDNQPFFGLRNIVDEGIIDIGCQPFETDLVFSVDGRYKAICETIKDIQWAKKMFGKKQKVRNQRYRYCFDSTFPKERGNLINLIHDIEDKNNAVSGSDKLIYFAANIRCSSKKSSTTESVISKIWHSCLGQNAMPFDMDSRKKMLDIAMRDKDMRKHIEAWQNY